METKFGKESYLKIQLLSSTYSSSRWTTINTHARMDTYRKALFAFYNIDAFYFERFPISIDNVCRLRIKKKEKNRSPSLASNLAERRVNIEPLKFPKKSVLVYLRSHYLGSTPLSHLGTRFGNNDIAELSFEVETVKNNLPTPQTHKTKNTQQITKRVSLRLLHKGIVDDSFQLGILSYELHRSKLSLA